MSSANRKKIVFLLNSFGIGGIERQLLAQLRRYDRTKYELHLVVLYNYSDRPNLYDQLPEDVTVHRFHCIYGQVNLGELWQVVKLLRRLKPDLVVSSMFGPNALNRVASIFLGYVPLAREHNTYRDRGFPQRVIEHIVSYISPTIVAVSKEVADFASRQSRIPRKKYTVIQNGVDLEQIERERKKFKAKVSELRAEFSLSAHGRVWLNVARLKKQKNHDLLIEAFAEYTKEHDGDHLFILGGGQEGARLREKVQVLGVADKIHITGYRADVFAFYELADYFILTSDIEGFPNVVLEAMAFGLPVLSTSVAGIDEILVDGENGYLLERSVTKVRDTMVHIKALPQEQQQAFKQQAVKSVKDFSIEKAVGRYEKLFEAILKK